MGAAACPGAGTGQAAPGCQVAADRRFDHPKLRKAKAPDEDFQPTWQTFYGSRGALNLGFSGDGTENVLWRLANGEVDGLQPKVALVLIGTNNTGHLGQTAEQTQLGIDAVVAAIEQSCRARTSCC